MSSKIIHGQKEFFTKLCVDAVLHLDQEDLNENLIGMKKVLQHFTRVENLTLVYTTIGCRRSSSRLFVCRWCRL